MKKIITKLSLAGLILLLGACSNHPYPNWGWDHDNRGYNNSPQRNYQHDNRQQNQKPQKKYQHDNRSQNHKDHHDD